MNLTRASVTGADGNQHINCAPAGLAAVHRALESPRHASRRLSMAPDAAQSQTVAQALVVDELFEEVAVPLIAESSASNLALNQDFHQAVGVESATALAQDEAFMLALSQRLALDHADALRGEQGLQGERGIQGEPGLQGERGIQGEQGLQGERGSAIAGWYACDRDIPTEKSARAPAEFRKNLTIRSKRHESTCAARFPTKCVA